jgi:hypothetical protein
VIACALAFALAASDQMPLVSRSETIVLKVIDRNQVSDAVVGKADELGGYFTTRNDQEVDLRVPQAELAELETFVATQGVVVTRQIATQDLGGQIESNRAIIATREGLLQRYLDAVSRSSHDGVVTIEREATRLVQEIESMKGALRLAEHQLAYGRLKVSFQMRDRTPPARNGTSSFKWVNGVNLADLIEAFQHDD